jgi:adenine-specific DNA-methyltransferase
MIEMPVETLAAADQKRRGAYYTPDATVRSLVQWAIRMPTDRLLDPACGDGRFLQQHKRSVGVEQDPGAYEVAKARAPWALIHEGDFFGWAERTQERFECAAGNPPFIRYQRFNGATRERALRLCARQGVRLSGLTSSWAPFLVVASGLLKPGGRLAFVVPAEIGHAAYAAPLLRHFLQKFGRVQVIAIRERVFSGLSEDTWLIVAHDYGGCAKQLIFTQVDRFEYVDEPPDGGERIPIASLERFGMRLRAFLLPPAARSVYEAALAGTDAVKLGTLAKVGIGYVTGANDFFHLRPSDATAARIPRQFLQPAVRNGRVLPARAVNASTVRKWLADDEPVLLLRLAADVQLPEPVKRYLDSPSGRAAQRTYKCRNREPWYTVPDVHVPNAFLTYMSGMGPALVANQASCVATNSLHTVRLNPGARLDDLMKAWRSPLTQLSCEVEGHPLGGGLLKLEPGEAQRVLVPMTPLLDPVSDAICKQAVETLRAWRHSGEAS